MIPVLNLSVDRPKIDQMLRTLRLDPVDFALNRGDRAKAVQSVQKILEDVARRGDQALVDSSRQFDDPNFTVDQICVTQEEMIAAAARVPEDQLAAIRRSIAQVREYQTHFLPPPMPALHRPGVELSMRF